MINNLFIDVSCNQGATVHALLFLTVAGIWSTWQYGNTTCIKLNDTTWGKLKYRVCNNPEPKYGGAACLSGAQRLLSENGSDICRAGKNQYLKIAQSFERNCLQNFIQYYFQC